VEVHAVFVNSCKVLRLQ